MWVVLAAQAALIAWLLVQLRRRRRVEAALRESEERFRAMANTAPVMVWRTDDHKRCDFLNQSWLDFTGRTLAQELDRGWAESVHPNDRDACLATFYGAFDRREPFRMEYRLRRADGEYRWILDSGVPRNLPDGRFAGYIGSCIDITERRDAEERMRRDEAALRESHVKIRDLAGRLITAQEEERARIARELHDDVSQQLAGFSIAISGVKRRPEAVDNAGLRDALAALQRRTIELTESVRHLSHELHPSVLEHIGLVDALRGHCAELARQHGIDIVVESAPDHEPIDPETALCLYRVAQEALRNVIKHADARHVGITLSGRDGELTLSIADDGKGFDPAGVRLNGGGLGLQSIGERVRLARGQFSIASTPTQGTTIEVRVRPDNSPAEGGPAAYVH